ncbi:VRR-NUC domain-containing protein [Salmonella enterica]|nr:VRR-NUC domain-containing protein [Salmonella enterica]
MVEKQARLPTPGNRQYLHIKVEYAMRFPTLRMRKKKNGDSSKICLKQLLLSGLIRVDEVAADYYWYYKAEVPFYMQSSPPRPYLSSTQKGADRRHTTNPFPAVGKGVYRRPDIIIVKNKMDRWPGLAGPDEDGKPHGDNLDRLVEVKFPGDEFGDGQYEDYMLIVGNDRNRMTILEIRDCRPDRSKEVDNALNDLRHGLIKVWPLFFFPPIFTPGPPKNPRPVAIQPWTYGQEEVPNLIEGVVDGIAEGWQVLTEEMRAMLEQTAGWLNDSGEWVYQQAEGAWHWVSDTGKQIASWTNEQLRAAWEAICEACDMTLEWLKQVDWVQLLTDIVIGVGFAIVAIGIGYLVLTVSIPAALVSALLLIVRLAISSWRVISAILGAGAAGTGVGAAAGA